MNNSHYKRNITSKNDRFLNKTQTYLMPIGSRDAVNHMNNTLLNSVDKQIILEHGVTPQNNYENDKINVWGLIPGPQNTKQWQDLSLMTLLYLYLLSTI